MVIKILKMSEGSKFESASKLLTSTWLEHYIRKQRNDFRKNKDQILQIDTWKDFFSYLIKKDHYYYYKTNKNFT